MAASSCPPSRRSGHLAAEPQTEAFARRQPGQWAPCGYDLWPPGGSGRKLRFQSLRFQSLEVPESGGSRVCLESRHRAFARDKVVNIVPHGLAGNARHITRQNSISRHSTYISDRTKSQSDTQKNPWSAQTFKSKYKYRIHRYLL